MSAGEPGWLPTTLACMAGGRDYLRGTSLIGEQCGRRGGQGRGRRRQRGGKSSGEEMGLNGLRMNSHRGVRE